MNAFSRLKPFIIPTVGFLTACAPHTPQTAEQQPVNKQMPLEQRKKETATVASWEIRGAMAAKSKTKGWSATLNWVQHGANSYQIRLIGPLGGGSVIINKKGNMITFQDGKTITSSTNADELLQQKTGVRLPVSNLYYWVRGLPAPGHVAGEQHDAANHLTQLQQSGYVINFTQYTSVKGIDLPSAIRLEGHGVMVKVTIKSWNT